MASLLLLVATLVASTEATCIREFFAQPVIYDRAMKIDFYYTGINQTTVAACAGFCGDRHFCRTAVFNTVTKTCAISYEYTLNCRYNEQRYSSFDLAGVNSHLIQVACVSKCNEENQPRSAEAQRDPPKLDSPGLPTVLKKVSLITAEPNDGSQVNDENGSFEVAPLNYAKLARARDPGYNAPNNNDIVKEEGYLNKVVIANISAQHDVVVNSMVKNGSQICYRRIQHKYLLGGSFQRHDGKTIIECRCLCAASYSAHILHRCQSFHWYQSGVCVLNKGSHAGKYDLIEDYNSTYEYVDCDVQVLLDVADEVCNQHENETTPAPKDIRRTTTSKGKKNTTPKPKRKRNRNGSTKKPKARKNNQSRNHGAAAKKPFATSSTTTTTTELPTTEKATSTEAPTTLPASKETTIVTTTSAPKISEKDVNSAASSAPEKQQVQLPTESNKSETEERAENQSEVKETKTQNRETISEAKNSGEIDTTTKAVPTTVTPDVTTTETPLTKSTTTEEPTTTTVESIKEKLHIEHHGCFERIDRHMMVSVAGGLEHDVSIEECQCLCANSKASGRYSFDCNSATYYHSEKDCVLNLEDRYQKKQFFEKQPGDFNVTYVGITCDRASAISSVVDSSATNGCRKSSPSTTPKPSRNRGSKGANSDKCFMELPSFVLEGTAQQVETGISAQECKCLCAQSEERYSEGCQSFQYYYDSKTCLLNKLNRFSNPENFNFVPGTQPRSYFEFRCASLEEKLQHYLANSCPNAKPEGQKEHSTDEPKSKEPEEAPTPSTMEEKNPDSNKSTEKEEGDSWADEDINLKKSSEESEKSDLSSEVNKTPKTSKTSGKRKDPELSGEVQGDVNTNEEEKKITETTTTTTTTTTTPEPTTTTSAAPVKRYKKIKKRAHINRDIPEAEGLDDADFEEEMEVEVTDAPLQNNILADPVVDNPHPIRAQGVKTQKFTDKLVKESIPLVETTAAPTTTTTTTEATTTTTTQRITTTRKPTTTTSAGPEYPSAGHCTYSALYQTQFQGRKVIKTVYVKNASDCFAACFVLRCRSASLVAEGALNQCILYRDSLIDYRDPNMLAYDRATVYFDGIRCDGNAS